jgi:RNA-dependent RNA polymerase
VLGIVAVNWLIIADQSLNGIFDQDCLTLADLHSDAVDYQKSGQPVPVRKIPKLKFRQRPDWSAPETVNPDSAHYYKSQRAIGKLFRAIDLPAVRDQRRASEEQYHRLTDDDASDLGELLSRLDLDTNEDPIYLAVTSQVTRFIALQQPVAEDLLPMFERFQMELQRICATHTLSHARSAILTEEEAVIGTIVAKTSQRRRRKELMSRMREQTDLLVRGIREELAGDDGSSREEWLERAYACWSYSLAFGKRFGAKSFGFVALGSIFEAIKAIEDADRGFSLGI